MSVGEVYTAEKSFKSACCKKLGCQTGHGNQDPKAMPHACFCIRHVYVGPAVGPLFKLHRTPIAGARASASADKFPTSHGLVAGKTIKQCLEICPCILSALGMASACNVVAWTPTMLYTARLDGGHYTETTKGAIGTTSMWQ